MRLSVGVAYGLAVLMMGGTCHVTTSAMAQSNASSSLKLASEGALSERFDGRVPVNTGFNVIVGLYQGPLDGAFSAQAIAVPLVPKPAGKNICLLVSSRDGRYSAENLYRIQDARGTQAKFDYQSRYASELAKFSRSGVGILIRETDDCVSPQFGRLRPAVADGIAPTNLLHAAVNYAADKTKAFLRNRNGDIILYGECRKDDQLVSVAFTTICTFKLDVEKAAQAAELLIELKETFKTRPEAYEIALEPIRK